MIIKILLFFLYGLYGSTPTSTSNNCFIEKEEDFSHLFTGKDKEYLMLRYVLLRSFYRKNFSFFISEVLFLENDDLERLLSKDEYYIISLETMKNQEQKEDIKIFFNSLIHSAYQDSFSSKTKDKNTETKISGKKILLNQYLPDIFYALLYTKVTSATEDYNFLGRNFSFKIDNLSPGQYKIIEEKSNNLLKNSNYYYDANKRLDVMLNFIKENFSSIWNSLIQVYEENYENDKFFIQDSFKKAYKTNNQLESRMLKDIKIKNELMKQLEIEKTNKKFNHNISGFIEEDGIAFLWSTFDVFVNSWEAKISFGHYLIDFSNEENNKNILPQRFLTFLPQNLFHRYFTPFEVLTFSLFLIKKLVKPSLAKKFLNDYFGSNFTKKQGVRYLDKYLLLHSGKLFIGVFTLHGLYKVIEPVKKELNKLEKI